MFAIKLYLILFVDFFRVSECKRRIQGGSSVKTDKTYAVYLVMAPLSERNYDSWICGGALVSSQFILSSAACVLDVDYMYAIAGYTENISESNIDDDACTKQVKKKVVYRCYPKKYQLKYDELDYWSYIDIAMLRVESPYHPKDVSFQIACSYIPQPIVVNYDKKFQDAGTDAFVLGWGHKKIWRKEVDLDNYNVQSLRYARILIEDKEVCINAYADYPNMTEVINEYMICASGRGNLDENGKLVKEDLPTADGCAKQMMLKGFVDEYCDEEQQQRRNLKSNQTNNASTIDIMDDLTAPDNDNTTASNRVMHNFRRIERGICQNDHGGPLVTWKGGREVLIGVASVFKVDNNSECTGPYLFTSTFCMSGFVECVLRYERRMPKRGKRSADGPDIMDICDAPASIRGFETVESYISWKDHPSGPAENEHVVKDIARHKKINEAVHDRFAVFKKTAHTETYEEIAKRKYLEMHRKAAMKRKAELERKEANKKSTANENYAPNPNYESYKHYSPNPTYEAKENDARDPNKDPKKLYARDPNYEVNKQYTSNPIHVTNKRFQIIEQNNDGLAMRPIRPIRS